MTADDIAPDEIQVGSGRAQLLADADRPGGFLLVVDRIRQSYVDLEDPTYLDFEYLRDLANIVDALADGPLAVTHIGGGGCTFPRYIFATRPGSTQIVLEPDSELIDVVRERLPIPRRSGIRIRSVGGVEGIGALKESSADVVVLDAFLGGRVPAELITVEFMADVARVLRPTGLFTANIADGPPLTYLRRALATLRTQFEHVLVISDSSVLRGRRFGNLVLAGSSSPLPEVALRRAAAASAFPRQLRSGRELAAFLGGAQPFTVLDSSRSPAPPDEAWRIVDA